MTCIRLGEISPAPVGVFLFCDHYFLGFYNMHSALVKSFAVCKSELGEVFRVAPPFELAGNDFDRIS